jgi:hypothetical protein
MSTSKTVKKSSKSTVAKIAKVSPTTKIKFLSLRPKGKSGPKSEVLALVPKTGVVTFKQLQARAEAKEVVNPAKLGKWIGALARDGRVELHA